MACLLKVLSDMLQNSQPLSHIDICPKPKCQTRPHRLFLSGATEFHLIQPLQNPSYFSITDRDLGLTDRDLGITEMGL